MGPRGRLAGQGAAGGGAAPAASGPNGVGRAAAAARTARTAHRSLRRRALAWIFGLRRALALAGERWLPAWALKRGPLDDQRLGRLGEGLAERHLARRGLEPLARRVRMGGVEVDLLLRHGPRLVVAEVKCSAVARDRRLAELWLPPGWRLDPARWQRLSHAARRVAGPGQPPARIDLVEVLVHGPERRIEVRWWPDRRGPLRREELGQGPQPIRGDRGPGARGLPPRGLGGGPG